MTTVTIGAATATRIEEFYRADWDAPAFSDDDPAAPSSPPLPAPQVDYGPSLGAHLPHLSRDAESLVRSYTARLEKDPRDADAYHHRAHALRDSRRLPNARSPASTPLPSLRRS